MTIPITLSPTLRPLMQAQTYEAKGGRWDMETTPADEERQDISSPFTWSYSRYPLQEQKPDFMDGKHWLLHHSRKRPYWIQSLDGRQFDDQDSSNYVVSNKRHRTEQVSSIPGVPPRQKIRKQVRFANSASTLRRKSILTQEEIHQRWYQPSDYEAFDKERCQTLIKFRQEDSMRQQQSLSHSNTNSAYSNMIPPLPSHINVLDMIGLEQQISKQQVWERKMYIMRCQRAVLQQQERFRMSRYNNNTTMIRTSEEVAESLKAVSELFSFSAHQRANIRALMQYRTVV